MKERIEYFDVLRLIACFLVILTHSVMPSADGTDGLYIFGLSFISSPSSELFLAISGALLLPTKVSMGQFYKRRFTKLLPPLIIWSVIGGLVEVFLNRFTVEQYVDALLMLPFRPIISVYWFMYVMVGLYLAAPIISEWLKQSTQKQLHFVLLIWFVTLLWPYFNIMLGTSYGEIGSHYQTLNFFGGFWGYWVLGYYLRRFPIKIGMNVRFVIPVVVLLINTGVVVYCKLMTTNSTADLLSNLQVGSAAMIVLIFTIIQALSLQLADNKSIKWGGGCFRACKILLWYLFDTYLDSTRFGMAYI